MNGFWEEVGYNVKRYDTTSWALTVIFLSTLFFLDVFPSFLCVHKLYILYTFVLKPVERRLTSLSVKLNRCQFIS